MYLMTWSERPEPDDDFKDFAVTAHSETFDEYADLKAEFAELLEVLPEDLPFPMVFEIDGSVRDFGDDDYDDLGSV